jgi:hypothetical protein
MTNTWMLRERWDALVRGEQCPLCAEMQSTVPANEFGYTNNGSARQPVAVG